MSYPYDLAIRFDRPSDPIRKFMTIAEAIDHSELFGRLGRVTMYRKAYDRSSENIVAEIWRPYIGDPDISFAELVALTGELSGEDLAIEGNWGIKTRYRVDIETNAIVQEASGICFVVFGSTIYRGGWQRMDVDAVYDAGNYYYFRGWGNAPSDIAPMNMAVVVDELKLLMQFGVRSIKGLHVDEVHAIELTNLCFHTSADRFGDDLVAIHGESPSTPITGDQIAKAAAAAPGIQLETLPNGLLVYNDGTVTESLKEFYGALQGIIRTR